MGLTKVTFTKQKHTGILHTEIVIKKKDQLRYR